MVAFNPLRKIGARYLDAQFIRGLRWQNPWSRTLYVSRTHERASDHQSRTGLDPEHPLSTFKHALTLARDGDTIIIAPGHTESIGAATTIDQDNLVVIGHGNRQQRPRITFGTVTTANLNVTGNGVMFDNIGLKSGIDSLANMLTVNGLDFVWNDGAVDDDASTQTIDAIIVNRARCTISGLRATQTTAGATSCISVNAAAGFVLRACKLFGDYSAAAVNFITAASVDVQLEHSTMENLNAVDCCVAFSDHAHSGWCEYLSLHIATDAQTTWITYAGTGPLIRVTECYGTNVKQESGKFVGTVSV